MKITKMYKGKNRKYNVCKRTKSVSIKSQQSWIWQLGYLWFQAKITVKLGSALRGNKTFRQTKWAQAVSSLRIPEISKIRYSTFYFLPVKRKQNRGSWSKGTLKMWILKYIKKLERIIVNIFPQELPFAKHLGFSYTTSLVSSALLWETWQEE